MKLEPGQTVEPRTLRDVDGNPVPLARDGAFVHLQLRRFAGCPICNLHLAGFARRAAELRAAGVHEVVVFHSPAAELRRHAGALPFTLVADPGRGLYRAFGAEAGARSLLHPGALAAVARSFGPTLRAALRGAPLPPLAPSGGRLGLPADLLIAADGTLAAVHYGAHADDQWSADDVLALAGQLHRVPASFRAAAAHPAA
jgi:peroxiredoxin